MIRYLPKALQYREKYRRPGNHDPLASQLEPVDCHGHMSQLLNIIFLTQMPQVNTLGAIAKGANHGLCTVFVG